MPRIAYLSPQPPAPTGIATYSAQVLSELRDLLPGGHVVDAPWPLGPRVDEVVERSDLAVYQIGNNAEFHGEIYRLAIRHPGLVVLHDLAIDDLVRWFRDRGDPVGLRAEAEADAARLRLFETRPDLAGPLETPWCAHLVRRSRGVAVHSSYGRAYLEAFGSRTPVHVVPHPIIERPRAARSAERRARAIRKRLGTVYLVGLLGDIGEPKQIEATLEAASRLPAAHVAIVGRPVPGYDVERVVAESEMPNRVTIAPAVSDRDFYAWLHACDVIVNLRHPHRGEVSGTLIRALESGKPVIAQAVGTYLDWPNGTMVRIPPGRPDLEQLTGALWRIAADPAFARGLGRRAREEIERQRAEGATAHAYGDAIDRTLELVRDPARSAVGRWASALAHMGVEEKDAGLALRHVEAIEEIAHAPVPGVEWAGRPGRYG